MTALFSIALLLHIVFILADLCQGKSGHGPDSCAGAHFTRDYRFQQNMTCEIEYPLFSI